MTQSVTAEMPGARTALGIIDCDVHNHPASDSVLYPYLSRPWQRHLETFGSRTCHGYLFPRGTPFASRLDSWPPTGGLPGSDLAFMQQQLLDPWNVKIGILNCMHEAGWELNQGLAAAMTRAINDWQIAEWLEPEPRLRASIVVPFDYPEAAVAEIDRVGDHAGFVQVIHMLLSSEPMGRRRYWPVYEAAERHGLAIGIHVGGRGGHPVTASGWPSYNIEYHAGQMHVFQAQVVSLVCEGVFVQFPSLRVALIEGGFAWLPSLMWRLDKSWKRLREEVPWLTQPPSEYIRQHMRVSTQPMEEPENPRHLVQVIDQLGSDMLMFATDYPHWDFDAPDRAFPITLPDDLKRQIMADNARAWYRL